MRAATWSVGLVSPRSTCESIGAEHAGAHGEVAQREVHRLPQRLHPRPDGRDGLDGCRHTSVCYRVRPAGTDSMITRHGRSVRTVSSVLPNSEAPATRRGSGITIAAARMSVASSMMRRPA